MSGKEYVIKYAAMDQLYVMICNRISGWYNELEDWSGEYERLVSMESFSGASAESAKAYLQEVHGLLVSFLQTTLQYYQARLLLYKIGYYDIDASLYSSIPQEILKEVQEKLGGESETLQEISDSIGRSVNSVSDLIYLKNPSIDNLKNTMDGLKSELGDFETEIGDYESSELQAVQSDVQGMIDSLQATVLDYLNNGTSIPSYQPGAVAGNTNMLDLYQRAVAAGQYVEEHQEEIELAAAEQEKAFAQMQADYEAACEAREQEGQVKMLQGALAAGVGIAAIVFTAGAATPIVVTAAVTGGCSIAYGVSTAAEGAQDWYLGSIGDLETAAVNPIRDTIFAGNQELYDLWGSLNMTVAGMCIPVGHAVNGAAGLGKGAVIRAAGRTIVTETVKDRAIDYVSGEITTFATEHLNLNQVQSAALNIGLNLGLDKGADWAGQKIGITEGPKFTDRMSYEDAKRYNQFMSEAELGIHNNHPGMSQADLDAWKLADAKVEEQLAVNKVNWDEVTALRAKELEIGGGRGKAENIIAQRTKGMDLTSHPITQKQLSSKKISELKRKIDDRTITKSEYEQYMWNKRFSKRRATGVDQFWSQERQRILNNESLTRNWTQEQINDILSGKKPKFDGKTIQGHHTYSASQYPQLANRGEIIYPVTQNEHFKGWHGGNWKNSLPGRQIDDIYDF